MDAPKLQPPDYLNQGKPPLGHVIARHLVTHAAGLTALVVGAVAFIVVVIRQKELWSQPDFRLTVPLFVATLIPAAISFVRKEGSYALPLLGLGMAGVAVVLGWFFAALAVAVVAAILLVALSAVS